MISASPLSRLLSQMGPKPAKPNTWTAYCTCRQKTGTSGWCRIPLTQLCQNTATPPISENSLPSFSDVSALHLMNFKRGICTGYGSCPGPDANDSFYNLKGSFFSECPCFPRPIMSRPTADASMLTLIMQNHFSTADSKRLCRC